MNDKEKRNKINSDTNHLIICRDNEMNISDFLDIIWRRKILILVLFIASVAIATLIVNNMKPIYRTSAKITGGIIYGEQNGDFNYRDSPENILKVVNANMFTDGIIKSLRLNIDYYNNLVFKGELSSHSNVITVFYDDSDKASGVKILEANLERLDEYYKSVNISKKLNMQKQYYSQKQILLTKMANIKRKISLRNYKLSSDINNIQKRYNLENNKLANQGKEIQATLDMIKQEEENLKIQLKNIDIVASHSSPIFCEPFEISDIVHDWAYYDRTLLAEIDKERKLLAKIYDELSVNNKIAYYFYGHFHQNYKTVKNDTTFICLPPIILIKI